MFNRFFKYFLMDDKKDGKDGGAGGDEHAKELAALKESNAALMARLDKLEADPKKKKEDPPEDPDLKEKARKEREEADKKSADTKSLEAALKFNLSAKEWIKTNQSLLPKNIEDIFNAAEKEKFDSAVEKDAAIKSGIIQSFFEIQANVELLTPGLKTALEDWQKLTKNGKQERAQSIYDNVFEPAFEMLRRLKKAEALGKGLGNGSDDAYKTKLMELSKKHYLGEKS